MLIGQVSILVYFSRNLRKVGYDNLFIGVFALKKTLQSSLLKHEFDEVVVKV